MIQFAHFNFNVLDLQRSIAFYEAQLGLKVADTIDGEGFKIVYLADGHCDFRLELTWLADRTEPYNLGDEEFHLAFTTDAFDALHAKHAAAGVICYENPAMGIYFIKDPDGYWVEIVPAK